MSRRITDFVYDKGGLLWFVVENLGKNLFDIYLLRAVKACRRFFMPISEVFYAQSY